MTDGLWQVPGSQSGIEPSFCPQEAHCVMWKTGGLYEKKIAQSSIYLVPKERWEKGFLFTFLQNGIFKHCFWYHFRLTEKLQEWSENFCHLSSLSESVNILLHLLSTSFSLHTQLTHIHIFFPKHLSIICRHDAPLPPHTPMCIHLK